jgi:tetratricopeptide (TPR) repeat protein
MGQKIGSGTAVIVLIAAVLAGQPAFAATDKGGGGGSPETLKQYVADLKKSPENAELREKVIRYAQTLKQKPPAPEEYERQMARGAAYLKKAADTEGYSKAIEAFKAAVALAPWMAEGYGDLAAAQEKSGQFAEAIQNLNFSLLADPNAKNARDIRNHIYELEVYAEDAKQALKAAPSVPIPPLPPPTPVKVTTPPPKKQQAAAPEKKPTNPKAFVGSWFYKDTAPRGGEDVTTQAFTITMGTDGKLVAAAPRRSTGATGMVTVFELADDSIRIQIMWKLANVPSYWKSEEYDLALSSDETKLKGSYKIKSSGKGEFAEDKVLFKQ